MVRDPYHVKASRDFSDVGLALGVVKVLKTSELHAVSCQHYDPFMVPIIIRLYVRYQKKATVATTFHAVNSGLCV